MRIFGSRHHILEMATIPRERDKLRYALDQARHAKRKSNLTRWAAINLLAWALIVSFWWEPYNRNVVVSKSDIITIYLPIITQ